KSICYPESYQFSTKATSWGCVQEKTALITYLCVMFDLHENFKVTECGFHTKKYQFIFEAAGYKQFCLKAVNNEFLWSHKHPHYYQVQTQLLVCKKEYCDFFVFTEKDYHLERIYPDEEFWAANLKKCSHF
ncbi:uncharacterized protein LOC135695791, partial [Rhopilema esculentum]|uniref:uncharacterized protein LOC135695791 n=1 Tax=Rhopilema esculentum TaxID=499914 RepID=UPI0031E1339D